MTQKVAHGVRCYGVLAVANTNATTPLDPVYSDSHFIEMTHRCGYRETVLGVLGRRIQWRDLRDVLLDR